MGPDACSEAATGAGAGRAPRAIAVLGMHRSGTSCLTGSLQRHGLYLGDVQERNPYNARGNRESLRIMHLNNAVLAHSGGAWDQPPSRLAWTAEHAAERDAIVRDLQAPGGPWGFKDPRTVFTLPFWREGIHDLSLVGAFRHPAAVARSLAARNGMPPAEAFRLWRAYNERMLEHRAQDAFPLLSFDLPPDDYARQLGRVASSLGLDPAGSGDPFFDAALRNDLDDDIAAAVPAELLDLHARMQQAAGVQP